MWFDLKQYFFSIFMLLVLTSCTSTIYQGSTPTFRVGVPVENGSNALIAAQSGLRASFDYTEPLTVVKVEQMSFADYSKFTGATNNRPADMQVWLVVYFNNQWQVGSRPPGTAPAPFYGCVAVAINAADGMPLEVLGPLQSDRIPECDN